MYISAPNQSLASNESVAVKARKSLAKKDLVTSVGAAVLWPAFAAGSFIFGMNDNSNEQPNVEPYRTVIK